MLADERPLRVELTSLVEHGQVGGPTFRLCRVDQDRDVAIGAVGNDPVGAAAARCVQNRTSILESVYI